MQFHLCQCLYLSCPIAHDAVKRDVLTHCTVVIWACVLETSPLMTINDDDEGDHNYYHHLLHHICCRRHCHYHDYYHCCCCCWRIPKLCGGTLCSKRFTWDKNSRISLLAPQWAREKCHKQQVPATGSSLTFHLGFVHPLQDVALHQCLPLSSIYCFPNPGGSLLLCHVVLPSSAWSSSWSLPSPSLPLCAAFGPPIVLHSCYMTGPFPLWFQCVFYDINYLCSFPDLWAWYLIL